MQRKSTISFCTEILRRSLCDDIRTPRNIDKKKKGKNIEFLN